MSHKLGRRDTNKNKITIAFVKKIIFKKKNKSPLEIEKKYTHKRVKI